MQRVRSHLAMQGLDLTGCVLSVDSAYVAPAVLEAIAILKIPMVSTLALKRRIVGPIVDDRVLLDANAEIWLSCRILLNGHRTKSMANAPEVAYQRQVVTAPSIGEILILYAEKGADNAVLFSTDKSMKAQTIVRTARRRWQLERVFWNLQQHLGIGHIRHTVRRKTLSRNMWAMILFTAIRKAAKKHGLSIGEYCDLLHRHRQAIIRVVLSGCSFSCLNLGETVPILPAAA